jgi:hypothetical protein
MDGPQEVVRHNPLTLLEGTPPLYKVEVGLRRVEILVGVVLEVLLVLALGLRRYSLLCSRKLSEGCIRQ